MDTRLTQTVSVADLVTYAYLNNPSILAAKAGVHNTFYFCV